MDPFALLDDARTGRATLYTRLTRVDRVDLSGLDAALAAGWDRGEHCLAWLPYDLAEAETGLRGPSPGALYWFAERRDVDLSEVLPADDHGWLADAAPDVTEAEFATQVEAIRAAIAAGTSYQVNYTHRVTGRVLGSPATLYARLRARQPVEFGVLARLPGPAAAWTLSLSPELFLHVADGVATSRPMKGTADADSDPALLGTDPKNRAENLMIVDLIRNDLSRVSVPGTVAVDRLFQVERVGSLWQMTSTVHGDLAPGTTPALLLSSLFPCGSITGAPKLASMRLIRAAEPTARGLYTGALGTIEPADDPLGWRMDLSVVIRTLEIDAAGTATLGVGSGIVTDSTAAAEWAECRAKARFATDAGPTVHLREAIRVVDGAAPLAARHRSRLAASARALGFGDPGDAVARAVAETPRVGAWRVGLDVAPDGTATVTRSPLAPLAGEVTVRLAPAPWRPGALARHKTSARQLYDDAVRAAEDAGAFDTIGYDADGYVLEGGRTSVVALVDGRWVTPPLDLGILDGVQRAEILARPELIGAGRIEERRLTVDELRRTDTLVVTNAVRGVLPARLEEN